MDISHVLSKEKSKKEILFTSYCCHQSMANNELLGPVLMNLLVYSGGHTNIFKTSNLINKPLLLVLNEYKFLKKQKLIKSVFF